MVHQMNLAATIMRLVTLRRGAFMFCTARRFRLFRMRSLVFGLIPTLIVLLIGWPSDWAQAEPSLAVQGPAVAYQIGTRHAGFQSVPLTTPLHKIWSNGIVADNYPLIDEDMVFVLDQNDLYALSESTGQSIWGPVDVGGTPIGMTADNGRLFVQVGALMIAYSMKTGREDWSAPIPNQNSFSSYPTAADGLVYTDGSGSGGTVYAFNDTNGDLAWTAPVDGGWSTPTVTSHGVYVNFACNQTYDFTPATGSVIWHYSGPCVGGGGSNSSLYAGSLYAPGFPYSSGLVFKARTGALTGTLASESLPPAFTSTGIELTNPYGTLSAENAKTQQALWSFTGDGFLGGQLPVTAGSVVYIASGYGDLYALSASTGKVKSKFNFGSGVTVSASLAVGGGILVVPTSSGLEAFS
jgi:outer membrane protein assembly factor BamB